MNLEKVENIIRKILPLDRWWFKKMCAGLNLSLSYSLNKDAFNIFKSIFIDREYAEYFPFGEEVTIVDIGGHYGFFAMFAAMNTHSESIIVSFEASSQNFEVMQNNFNKNPFTNIQSYNKAVSHIKGKIDVYGGKSFNHSTLKSPVSNKLNEVESTTLAQIVEDYGQVDFLKIDCEGAEYEILLNSTFTVLKNIRVISLEFHDRIKEGLGPEQLRKHLSKCGFKTVKYQHSVDRSFSNNVFGRMIFLREE